MINRAFSECSFRVISQSDIILFFDALGNCEVVEAYLHDKPLPSFLLLGYSGRKALHMVAAVDETEQILWIILTTKNSSYTRHHRKLRPTHPRQKGIDLLK